MWEMGAETMNLPLEEKMKYEQGDNGMSFGYAKPQSTVCFPWRIIRLSSNVFRYKMVGANATDETGSLDTIEGLNIAKDDAIAWPKQARRAYPSTVNARMDSTIIPFVRKSLEVNETLLNVLNDRLCLPKGTLAKRHRLDEYSGSEARLIKNPAKPGGTSELKVAMGAHTDFGSLVNDHLFLIRI